MAEVSASDGVVALPPYRTAAPTVSASVAASRPEQVMPGEVIVKLRAGADAATVARAHGLAVGAAGYKNAFVVLRAAVGAEHAAAARLTGDARVEYAEPNYLRQTTAIDSRLWAFYNPGGLNMKFTSGSSKGQFLPISYASASPSGFLPPASARFARPPPPPPIFFAASFTIATASAPCSTFDASMLTTR